MKKEKLLENIVYEENHTTIANLPEECLIEIFKFLPIADRARIERVSKTWQILAKQSWHKVKEFNIDPKFLGLKPFGIRHKYKVLYESNFREILKRCGNYLIKIDLSSYRYSVCLLSAVAEYCYNIQSIKCYRPSETGILKLAKNCTHISEFICSEIRQSCEDAVAALFSVNKNFQTLKIFSEYLTGNCLLNLPLEEMISIDVNGKILKAFNIFKKTKKLSVFKSKFKGENLIKNLAIHCSNLTILKLYYYTESGDDIVNNLDFMLSKLFKNNQNLKSLDLENFYNFTGECLLSLNKNKIEEICLSNIDKIHGIYFVNSLPYFVKLHKIYLCSIGIFGDCDKSIRDSISLCSNLKELTVMVIQNYLYDDFKESIISLKNIESLKFYMNQSLLNNSLFPSIGCTLLKLKYLDIKCCTDLTDNDLDCISNLSNLEELNISSNGNVTGSTLVKFSKLKKLHCSYCNSLESDNLISFMRCAINLEFLNVSDCMKIETSAINAAIEITKK